MPLIVCVVNGTEEPPRVIEVSVFPAELIGSIARSPFEPEAALIEKPTVLPFHEKLRNVDLSRPSVQSSACFAEITGTPFDFAEAITASESGLAAMSVWIRIVNRPE